MGFLGGTSGKEPTCQCRRHMRRGLIPGLGWSPGGGHGNPLQYSCLDNPHGQRSLAGPGPWRHRVGHDWVTKHTHTDYLEHLLQFLGPKCVNKWMDISHCLVFSKFLKILRLPHWKFSSVQSLSPVQLFVTPWTAARQASLSITNSWSVLKLMSIESLMPSNHLILCHPLFLLPSIFPSIRVFSNESVLHIRWPNHWSFSFSISPSNEYSGLISCRIDWFDLAVQGPLKILL